MWCQHKMFSYALSLSTFWKISSEFRSPVETIRKLHDLLHLYLQVNNHKNLYKYQIKTLHRAQLQLFHKTRHKKPKIVLLPVPNKTANASESNNPYKGGSHLSLNDISRIHRLEGTETQLWTVSNSERHLISVDLWEYLIFFYVFERLQEE